MLAKGSGMGWEHLHRKEKSYFGILETCFTVVCVCVCVCVHTRLDTPCTISYSGYTEQTLLVISVEAEMGGGGHHGGFTLRNSGFTA